MNPIVSVVIPCYNQWQYVQEAINSVLVSTYQDIEIIIIDDGSVENTDIAKNFSSDKTQVIFQENQGVSVARNNAIKLAKGKYILPLDADDKIHPEYIEKAVQVLENDSNIGLVYCRAEFFGDKSDEWKLDEFKMPDFLWSNCIFNAGMYKKSDWEQVGGYKEEMKYGFEDWEMWLSFVENDIKFYKIPEILFYYRQYEGTRSSSTSENRLILIKQLMKLHPNLYIDNLESILVPLQILLQRFIPKSIKKQFYKFRIKLKIWMNQMLQILVEKQM